MKKILLLLLILPALACSGSILKPTATMSAIVSLTEQILLSPTPTIKPGPEKTETPDICTVTAAESLHLRDAPNIEGTVITWLTPGDELTLLPDPPSGDWVKVQFGKFTGWIHSNYCER